MGLPGQFSTQINTHGSQKSIGLIYGLDIASILGIGVGSSTLDLTNSGVSLQKLYVGRFDYPYLALNEGKRQLDVLTASLNMGALASTLGQDALRLIYEATNVPQIQRIKNQSGRFLSVGNHFKQPGDLAIYANIEALPAQIEIIFWSIVGLLARKVAFMNDQAPQETSDLYPEDEIGDEIEKLVRVAKSRS